MGRRNYSKSKGKKVTSGSNASDVQSKGTGTRVDAIVRNAYKTDDKSSDGSQSNNSASNTLDKYTRKTNDPAWYMYSPEQVNAVARLPFSEAFGDPLPVLTKDELIRFNGQETTLRRSIRKAIPGIAAIRTRPTFGANFSITDPLNVCATELYSFTRYVNNGRKNYDPADLMIHVLAVADIYSYIMWMKKIYGLAFIYSTRNYYMGKALLAACNVDPDSIIQNLANMRYWLNTYINKVSAYVVPETINIFKRRAFMYADVYTESETNNIKDQLYTFTPDGFFRFAFDSVGAGMLEYVPCKSSPNDVYTFEQLMLLGESLFENINQDEDFGLMSGDLLKAFGGNILKVEPLNEEYIIEPHFDHEVLHQIMNGTIDGNLSASVQQEWNEFAYYSDPTDETAKWNNMKFRNGNVYQTPDGILVHAFTIVNQTSTGQTNDVLWEEMRRYKNVLLNTDLPQVDVEHIMEMTRLSFALIDAPYNWRAFKYGAPSSDTARTISYFAVGSDVITNISVYVFDENHNMNLPGSDLSRYDITEDFVSQVPQVEGLYTLIDRCARKIKFRYLPPLWVLNYTPGATDSDMGEAKIVDIWQDLQNYTFVSPVQLDRIHKVAMFSLAHVPGVARNINS